MTEIAASLYKAIGMARIGEAIPNIADPLASPVKGALLGLMLPSLHLLTVVSVLDDGLSAYIEDKSVPWPPKTRRDLCNRIDVVARVVPTIPKARLHQIRELRNSIAHSLGPPQDRTVTWAALDGAIADIAVAFVAMGVIDAVPGIVAYYERKPTLFLDDLGPSGERMRHAHHIEARLNETVILEYSTEVSYYPPEAP
jgi:hypothetical protein